MTTSFDKYVGLKFQKLTILEICKDRPFNKTYFICKCDCGTVRKVNATKVILGKVVGCQNCKLKRESNPNWTGYKELSGTYLKTLRRNCRQRKGEKTEFNVTAKYLWELFQNQNRKCNLSGLDITLDEDSYTSKLSTASIDRIDSSKGYIKGNVQWVHKRINTMKMDLSDDKFIGFCTAVANHKTNMSKKDCMEKVGNYINVIYPYSTPNGGWYFDDSRVGLLQEAFVLGIDTIITHITKDIPGAIHEFQCMFSGGYFPGYSHKLIFIEKDDLKTGNWYQLEGTELKGWLCPALYKYYEQAPKEIYIKIEPLNK